jgi:DNA polymerase III psi subunit
MAITSRQFDQLSEMGISLWQSRKRQNTEQTKQDDYLPQNQQSLTTLSKQKLFSDILLSLSLTLGEVKAQDNHLDVGLFNWYFLNRELNGEVKEKAAQAGSPQQKPLIHCIDNKLVTPSIETIAQSANLKKQLWHIITKHLL